MSKKFCFDEPLSPWEELINLLDYNGIQYEREANEIRFVLAEGACKWQSICRWAENTVIIYSIYPFSLTDKIKAKEAVNEINSRMTRGCAFVRENAVIMRQDADLFDAYSAYEAIARAIEYNAGAVVAFWSLLAAEVN